eukprot:178492-Hanusia_phi.AAC.2
MTETKQNESFDHDANTEETSGRPVRRSRLLSDDARLALQLQEQELRSARGGFQTSRKRSRSSSSSRKDRSSSAQKQKNSQPGPPSTASPKSRQKTSPASGGKKTTKPPAKTTSKPQPSKPRSSAKKSKAASSHQDDGFVLVGLEPWPGSDEKVPAVKSKSLRVEEDSTVLNIKRQIINEAYPGENVSKIEVRTKAGLLLGQDHSLRYVRQFLWPESKGDLVLYYSKGKDSLF